MTTAKKMSSIELLVILKQLRLLNNRIDLPVECYNGIEEAILDKIGQSEETINRRLEGLKTEDEFLLMCMILGSMDNVIPIPQKQYLDKEYVIPDFIISIKNENKPDNFDGDYDTILVETKKMKKNHKEYVVSLNYIKKINKYAQMMNLPLFFAIKADLVDYGFFQWILVPSTIIENEGKIEKRKIHGGRNEKSYVIDILKLYSNDHLGLWFNNPNILLSKGYKYIREYSKHNKTFITETKYGYGYLISATLQNGDVRKKVEFEEKLSDNRKLIFYELCGFLCQGMISMTEDDDFSNIIVEADHNYLMPFYHILIKTYLNLRKEFYRRLDGLEIDEVSYYIENYSDIDKNIVAYIKDILYELNKLNIIKIIRMMPY